jgi:RNA polymerase sigma factor (sigma-70 family)
MARDPAEAQDALARLCTDYWYPLYAFARRQGFSLHDAQDLTQAFFAYVLERGLFSFADQQLGRLRTFLLTAFTRFIRDAQSREQTLKRGGGHEILRLDVMSGEERYAAEMTDDATPEKLFERSWALAVLDAALRQLGADEAAAGRAGQFRVVESMLSPTSVADGSCAEAAARLGQSEAAVWQIVSRLRTKFRQVLRGQIAATLRNPSRSEIEEELASLSAALRR